MELVSREAATPGSPALSAVEFNLSQTMIRIKDPTKSIPFYRDLCGMEVRHTDSDCASD